MGARRVIGILDYGVGNHASVKTAILGLGHRYRVSNEKSVLDATDMLLLPGVGAFPTAMKALHEHDLVDYVRNKAREGKPILGICLGMQLLADASNEFSRTAGLGLVPGEVSELGQLRGHIGWNTIEVTNDDPLFKPSDGQSMYFNHSFVLRTAPEHTTCVARIDRPFAVAVRRNNVAGFQFHPEKSQAAGRELLGNVIAGLTARA